MIRVKNIWDCDPDYRHEPKTDVYCILCQRDIKDKTKARGIHIINGGDGILHPEDEALYTSDGGDCGIHYIGPECAKKIGRQWTHK